MVQDLSYIVYDEGTFSDAGDLSVLLERMISNHMPLSVRPGDRLSFRRDLSYESVSDGFQISTRFKRFEFRHKPYLKDLGDAIYHGGRTVEEVIALFQPRGISSAQILHSLNLMLKRGILDDEPQPQDSVTVVKD